MKITVGGAFLVVLMVMVSMMGTLGQTTTGAIQPTATYGGQYGTNGGPDSTPVPYR